ncbi:MAG: acetylglutamate kinase [Clostridiales bacterium]|jgi:acetylglutamate kinase|nr:acetylglutamate kinase [Clostridiales bacterium]HOB63637.1 acetylglutamate kinase [Clostridia bacterium]HOK82087.1 acetylglutamate kinase [Clostridia bacterium]HOL61027.1 acetylglutamate kinase [Clostridia bacterium]HPO54176.1 acetylglutamate kinase [Clostridia bacterium]
MDGISNESKAAILAEALPYIQRYNGSIVVIKYGGNAMINPELKDSVMQDVVLLTQVGIKVVLVHGGGPEINDTLSKMNIKSTFVNGLRQTDEQTMAVVQMVLAGKVNKDLVNLIGNTGGKALGLSGIDGHMIEARKINEVLGYAGEIVSVDATPILNAFGAGYIPVIATIGYDKEGKVYNINADDAASAIAAKLEAACLIFLTDIKGIMKDPKDETSLIPEMTAETAEKLISEGVIKDGMIPKARCCIEAIKKGVKKVFIIDGRVPHSLLIEMLSDKGIGTMFK